MEFNQLISDIQIYIPCKREMLTFETALVIKQHVWFSFCFLEKTYKDIIIFIKRLILKGVAI